LFIIYIELLNEKYGVMKNRFFSVFFLFTGLLIIGLTGGAMKPSLKIKEMKPESGTVPPGILKIVQHSCFACHGPNGKGMALAHVKMAEWDAYSIEKQADKAADMCKMISKGKMPPKGYLSENPDRALNQAQIDSICAWSASLNKEK
jgi:hypothetical protein